MTDAAELWELAVRDITDDLHAHRPGPGELIEAPGVIGILNSHVPFPFYVHRLDADLLAVLPRIEATRPRPRLHVIAGHPALPELEAAGWTVEQHVTQMVLPATATILDPPPVPGLQLERLAIPQGIPTFYAAMAAGFGDDLGDAEEELPREVIVTQGIQLFVARDETGQVIGTAGARRRGQGSNLFAISVVPEHRRRRVGTALTVLATRAMLDSGAASVHLHATVAGYSVYERTGFEVAGSWVFYRPPVTDRRATAAGA